jgi:hypothetical protein
MKLSNLLKDKKEETEGMPSLSRSTAFLTFAILSAGFILNAYKKTVSWEVYIAFPLGVTIAFLPVLFLRLLNGIKDVIAVWKGNQSNE